MRFVEIEKQLIALKNEIIDFKDYINIIVKTNEELSDYKKKRKHSDESLLEFIKVTLDEAGLFDYFHVEMNSLKENIGAYTNTEIKEFNDALNSILNKVDLLFHVESLTRSSQEKYNYIYAIKLPKYEYFEDVADFTKQLNFIFSTVMYNNGKVKLVGFDKGSEWYQVALDSLVDFKLMALFITEVTKYVKIKLEDRQRENEIDLDDEIKKVILDNMATNQMAIKEHTVKRILNESGYIDDHEEYEKHQRAFEYMAELMIRGTRVEVDKQTTTNDSEQDETNLQLPSLESVQRLLDTYSDILIEHIENDEE
ncbi:hypothetical protein ACOMCU_10515 [Lysinibacillus sp. UGB7]|uniref:hypothetical protein n=1 Tax=Lysinibacillus sp. UGB7 TaxID=3411039 RepID=UPI003B7CD930